MQNSIENIADFFHAYKKAAWDRNVSGMINLYDHDVLVFDMWGKGFIAGITEWTHAITDWLTSLKDEKVNVNFEMIQIQESESVGFATALIQFQAISVDNEIVRSMKNRISLGFVKKDGVWKVKHQHTSAPIDSNLKAILDV
jgi:ketosteroid isomerase-like protein